MNPNAKIPDAAFDPTRDVFTAMDRRPAGLAPVRAADLGELHRVLLVVDGTVTKIIEAFAGERVDVHRLEQSPGSAGAAGAWLDCPPDTPVLHRRSMLIGAASGQLHAFAESVLMAGRLGAAMLDDLDHARAGLGQVLGDARAETRREALWFGLERPADLPEEVARRHAGPFLSRSYRIFAGGRPILLITERFPLTGGG